MALRFLLIGGNPIVLISRNNHRSILFYQVMFLMTHHTGSLLSLRKTDKTLMINANTLPTNLPMISMIHFMII